MTIGISLFTHGTDPDSWKDTEEGDRLRASWEWHNPNISAPGYEADRTRRIDTGEECPTCHRGQHWIDAGHFGQISQFRCRHCGAEWFDSITTPSAQ